MEVTASLVPHLRPLLAQVRRCSGSHLCSLPGGPARPASSAVPDSLCLCPVSPETAPATLPASSPEICAAGNPEGCPSPSASVSLRVGFPHSRQEQVWTPEGAGAWRGGLTVEMGSPGHRVHNRVCHAPCVFGRGLWRSETWHSHGSEGSARSPLTAPRLSPAGSVLQAPRGWAAERWLPVGPCPRFISFGILNRHPASRASGSCWNQGRAWDVARAHGCNRMCGPSALSWQWAWWPPWHTATAPAQCLSHASSHSFPVLWTWTFPAAWICRLFSRTSPHPLG